MREFLRDHMSRPLRPAPRALVGLLMLTPWTRGLWFTRPFRDWLGLEPYYANHYAFELLLRKDPEFARMWEETPRLSARPLHALKWGGLFEPLSRQDGELGSRPASRRSTSSRSSSTRADVPPGAPSTTSCRGVHTRLRPDDRRVSEAVSFASSPAASVSRESSDSPRRGASGRCSRGGGTRRRPRQPRRTRSPARARRAATPRARATPRRYRRDRRVARRPKTTSQTPAASRDERRDAEERAARRRDHLPAALKPRKSGRQWPSIAAAPASTPARDRPAASPPAPARSPSRRRAASPAPRAARRTRAGRWTRRCCRSPWCGCPRRGRCARSSTPRQRARDVAGDDEGRVVSTSVGMPYCSTQPFTTSQSRFPKNASM